jgi:adenine C2-methylase RlmN of 23S rRNA A2503 and tRNA A37
MHSGIESNWPSCAHRQQLDASARRVGLVRRGVARRIRHFLRDHLEMLVSLTLHKSSDDYTA